MYIGYIEVTSSSPSHNIDIHVDMIVEGTLNVIYKKETPISFTITKEPKIIVLFSIWFSNLSDLYSCRND